MARNSFNPPAIPVYTKTCFSHELFETGISYQLAHYFTKLRTVSRLILPEAQFGNLGCAVTLHRCAFVIDFSMSHSTRKKKKANGRQWVLYIDGRNANTEDRQRQRQRLNTRRRSNRLSHENAVCSVDVVACNTDWPCLFYLCAVILNTGRGRWRRKVAKTVQ